MIRLSTKDCSKLYKHNGNIVKAANNINAEFREGELTVIFGGSGSGKSTLLLMLGGLMQPSTGTVEYNGDSIYDWNSKQIRKYRNRNIGFIFQKFFLIPYLSIKENIVLPFYIDTDSMIKSDILLKLADKLGLKDKMDRRPNELSVGEQQRATLMRAFACNPKIILADEPTGNLDPTNTTIVADALRTEASAGKIVVMVTHNHSFDKIADKIITLNNGNLQ